MTLYKNNKQGPDDPPWYQQIVNAITTAVTGTPEGYEKTDEVYPDGTPVLKKVGVSGNKTVPKTNIPNPSVTSPKISAAGTITNPFTKQSNRSSNAFTGKQANVSTPVVTSQATGTTTASGTPKTKKPLAQTKGDVMEEAFNINGLRNPNATQFGWNENGITEYTPTPIEEAKQEPLAPRIVMTANGEQVVVPQEHTLESGVTIPAGTYSSKEMQKTVAEQSVNNPVTGVGQSNDDVGNTKTDLELAIDELMKNYEKNQKDKKIALAGKYGKDNLMTMLEFIRNERQGLPEDVPTPVMRTPDLIDTTSADMAMLQKKEAEGYSAIREIGNATGNLEMIKSASASLNSDVMNNVINLAKQKQANINTQRTMATEVANKNNVAAAETKKINLERIGVANDKTGAIRSQLLSQFGKMDADYVANKFKLRNQDQNQKVFKLLLDQYRAHAGEQAYLDLVAQYGLSGVEAERTVVAPNSAAAEEKQEGGK